MVPVMTGTDNLIGGFIIIGRIVAVWARSFMAAVLFLMSCMALTAVAVSAIGHELMASERAPAMAA